MSPESKAVLPSYAKRTDAPRDLRTAEELAENGYMAVGSPRALLRLGEQSILLYSTTEARQLKHSLWPRGPKVPGRGQNLPTEHQAPLGGSRRLTNLGSSSALRPGQAGWRSQVGTSMRGPERTALTREWATDLFNESFLILDTETTGLGRGSEIIEIAVLNSSGETLLETRVWPRAGRVPQSSTRVHGLTLSDLEGAPTWPEVLLELERKLEGRRVLAWNAPFDERMAHQSSRLYNLRPSLPHFECAMRGYAASRGVGTLSMRLERAAQVERVLGQPQAHRSLGDTQLVLAVPSSLLHTSSTNA